MNQLTEDEINTIDNLRCRGFAVIVFNPQELRDADPGDVADRLIQVGWDVIDGLASYQQED